MTRRRSTSVHNGQFVLVELTALALVLAALSGSPLGWLLATPVAVALGVLAFGRWRHAPLGTALRYATRTRTLPVGNAVGALLALVERDGQVGRLDAYGVVEGRDGFSAVIAIGDPATLTADTGLALPPPAQLLPPPGADAPPVQVQLLVAGSPAPALRSGAGLPAATYRELAEGRGVAQARAYLSVRVLRDGTWPDAELRRTLTAGLHRIRRRLDQDSIPYHPLGDAALAATIAELGHHAGTGLREGWPGVQTGALRQACLRVGRLAALDAGHAGQLIGRLLMLPATATTVSMCASHDGTEVVVRVAAPRSGTVNAAVDSARRLLGATGLATVRLDGQQLGGLAATLPLGRLSEPEPSGALAERPVELPVAGLLLGRNRRGRPVVARLVRPEPTRALLVGGIPAAKLLTLRALALGVQVAVRTGTPQVWEPFLRAVSQPTDPISLAPPGDPVGLPAAGPYAPVLVVTDGDPPSDEAPWRTTLVVRDRLEAADLDLLAQADLAILQPLSPGEATLAGTVLGLGESHEWLARIGVDLVAVVNRRTVRFARLGATPRERQLTGDPQRVTVP